mgnify:CR=1 FL=1
MESRIEKINEAANNWNKTKAIGSLAIQKTYHRRDMGKKQKTDRTTTILIILAHPQQVSCAGQKIERRLQS